MWFDRAFIHQLLLHIHSGAKFLKLKWLAINCGALTKPYQLPTPCNGNCNLGLRQCSHGKWFTLSISLYIANQHSLSHREIMYFAYSLWRGPPAPLSLSWFRSLWTWLIIYELTMPPPWIRWIGLKLTVGWVFFLTLDGWEVFHNPLSTHVPHNLKFGKPTTVIGLQFFQWLL